MDIKVEESKVVEAVVAQVATPAVKLVKPGHCNICGKPLSKGDVGNTCQDHIGKLRKNAVIATVVPEGYIRMSKVCRAWENTGGKTGQLVDAAGGDACTEPVLDPVFKVTYVGSGKWMNPEVITRGFDILRKAIATRQEAKAPKTVAEKAAIADAKKASTTDTAAALKSRIPPKQVK